MEDKKTFGEFITQKRKESGLTQKGFAEQLYLSESAVSKWERGISYPDITMIRDICTILKISEHELLTASEDLELRKTEKLAARYLKIVNSFKYTLIIMYGLSLLTCFICNLAVNHTLSWFFIVLTAELVAFTLTLLPILLTKNRGLITLGAFTLSLVLLLLTCSVYTGGDWFFLVLISVLFGLTLVFLPFVIRAIWLPEYLRNHKALLCILVDTILLFALLFVCNLYTKGTWFFTIALPITLVTLIIPWSMLLIIRYLKVNPFLKASGCFTVLAVFNYFIQGFINRILGIEPYEYALQFNFLNWNLDYINGNIRMIILLFLIGMAVIYAFAGIIKTVRRQS